METILLIDINIASVLSKYIFSTTRMLQDFALKLKERKHFQVQ